MSKTLIIVESPTKAKTISKFLNNDYIIQSSFGHVRDLPVTELGIDTDNNFEPKYINIRRNSKHLSELKKYQKQADNIILATDEDREGEAISWHLAHALKIKPEATKRIVFHEITKKAILKALETPRKIDMKMVDAQQARRILDRLVGYKLSPLLWKKISKGLSAGRVQSIAVRIIVDREREIEAFKPQEYWDIEAIFSKDTHQFSGFLSKITDTALDKIAIKNKEEADKILADLGEAKYKIASIEKKETRKNPPAPFTTSTLQQSAANRFGFSAKQTMRLAQQLYETGKITYMRTDSLNLSTDALSDIKKVISDNFGNKYILPSPRFFKTKSKGAQEAHEAIRPTEAERTPDSIKSSLDDKQYKLYNLIWQRSIACQMPPAIMDTTTIDTKADKYTFRTNGSTIKFDGYLKVYPTQVQENMLPELKEKEILDLVELKSDQHFTQPPARFSEASLIKILERHGIGRPSTYAPTISTIIERGYVEKIEKRFHPQEIGIAVNDLLVEHFPEIVDIEFTAKMEDDLDDIADGKIKWQPVIKEFYEPFAENLAKKYKEIDKKQYQKETDEKCEKCGAPMIIRMGRYGKFLACSAFPKCKNAKDIKDEKEIKEENDLAKIHCPKCQKGTIVKRKTRKRGKVFYGCSKYPKCDYAAWKLEEITGE